MTPSPPQPQPQRSANVEGWRSAALALILVIVPGAHRLGAVELNESFSIPPQVVGKEPADPSWQWVVQAGSGCSATISKKSIFDKQGGTGELMLSCADPAQVVSLSDRASLDRVFAGGFRKGGLTFDIYFETPMYVAFELLGPGDEGRIGIVARINSWHLDSPPTIWRIDGGAKFAGVGEVYPATYLTGAKLEEGGMQMRQRYHAEIDVDLTGAKDAVPLALGVTGPNGRGLIPAVGPLAINVTKITEIRITAQKIGTGQAGCVYLDNIRVSDKAAH